MNDFDWDALQKKRVAQGAMHKKNGSKSKKCTLPSDYLTKKEKEALNGPVTEINLNEPMDWKTFKGLSDSLKFEYIKHLQETWHANTAMLSKMFGVTAPVVRGVLIDIGISTKRDRSGGTRGAEFKAKQAAWDAFCNGVVGGGDNQTPEEEKANTEAVEENVGVITEEEWQAAANPLSQPAADSSPVKGAPSVEVPEGNVRRLDMTFAGWPDELTMTILRNMFHDQTVKVRISAEVIA